MKTLKKLGVLALVLVMALSFAACSKDEGSKEPTPAPAPAPAPVPATKTDVEKYVETNSATLLAELETGFEQSSGIECDSRIEANGNDMAIWINMGGIDNVPGEAKAQLQATYDSMNGTFETLFGELKKTEIPSLENVGMYICEEDGDVLAKIEVSL